MADKQPWIDVKGEIEFYENRMNKYKAEMEAYKVSGALAYPTEFAAVYG